MPALSRSRGGRRPAPRAGRDHRRLHARRASFACSSRRAGAASRSTARLLRRADDGRRRRARRARGCSGVVGVHAWQLALFPREAQEDVWGKDPRTLISSSYAPTGKVDSRRGRLPHQRALVVLQRVRSLPVGVPRRLRASRGRGQAARDADVPPAAAATTASTTTGTSRASRARAARTSSSRTRFVPEHRTHRLIDGFKRKSPGNAVNPAPLYRLPFGQIFVRSVSTSAIGAAPGRLDAYRDVAAKRVAASDGAKVAEDPATQTRLRPRGGHHRRGAARPLPQLRRADGAGARRRGHPDRAARAVPLRLGEGRREVRRGDRRALHRERRARHLPDQPAPPLLPRRPRGARPLREQPGQAGAQLRRRRCSGSKNQDYFI